MSSGWNLLTGQSLEVLASIGMMFGRLPLMTWRGAEQGLKTSAVKDRR
jgi:hypothetical protein